VQEEQILDGFWSLSSMLIIIVNFVWTSHEWGSQVTYEASANPDTVARRRPTTSALLLFLPCRRWLRWLASTIKCSTSIKVTHSPFFLLCMFKWQVMSRASAGGVIGTRWGCSFCFCKNGLNLSVNFRSRPSTFTTQQPKDGSSLRLIPLSILPCHWSCGLSLLVHFTYIYQHCTRPRIRSHTRGTAASLVRLRRHNIWAI